VVSLTEQRECSGRVRRKHNAAQFAVFVRFAREVNAVLSPWPELLIMGAPMLKQELTVALQAARTAADIVMKIYATDFNVDFKGRNDPVTEADRLANEAIIESIGRAFPDDGICAEESPATECLAAAGRGGRCWFIDPLDGTREFVSKNGEFCVMIGLAVDSLPTLGVVIAPAWNRTLWGIVGVGAWEHGVDGVERKLVVNPPPDNPRHARLVVSRSHMHPNVSAVADSLGIGDVHPCGSVGLKTALVATGEADLYVHAGPGPKLWDGCAPEALARATGLTVSDGAGNPLRYDGTTLSLDRGIVIAAPSLHAAAVRAFSQS
jgi:3'(2'), 5'-bisphosphate nucleotidase